MDEKSLDYIANLITTALLNGSKERNEQLRQEHEIVIENFIKND